MRRAPSQAAARRAAAWRAAAPSHDRPPPRRPARQAAPGASATSRRGLGPRTDARPPPPDERWLPAAVRRTSCEPSPEGLRRPGWARGDALRADEPGGRRRRPRARADRRARCRRASTSRRDGRFPRRRVCQTHAHSRIVGVGSRHACRRQLEGGGDEQQQDGDDRHGQPGRPARRTSVRRCAEVGIATPGLAGRPPFHAARMARARARL